MIIQLALQVLGAGLLLAGAAHALLPRVLGWTAATGQADGTVSALVIRMHVLFIGLFLALVGMITLAAAAELAAGGRFAALVCLGCATVFGVRWVAEIVWVGRALGAAPGLSRRWWRWHLAAMIIIWPAVTVVYAIAGIRALG